MHIRKFFNSIMLTKLLYGEFKYAFGQSAGIEYLNELSSLERFSFLLLSVKCVS